MKIRTLTQTEKQHNVNALHDAFIAAEIVPLHAEASNGESRFTFDDSVSDTAINNVITAYVYAAPPIPADIKALGVAYRAAVTNATTLAQCKSVLNGELWVILKEIAKRLNQDL